MFRPKTVISNRASQMISLSKAKNSSPSSSLAALPGQPGSSKENVNLSKDLRTPTATSSSAAPPGATGSGPSKENINPMTAFKTPSRGPGAQESLSHSRGQRHQPGPGDLHSASSVGFKTPALPREHLFERTNLVRKIALEPEVFQHQIPRLPAGRAGPVPGVVGLRGHRREAKAGDEDDDRSFHASTILNSTELPDAEYISPEFLNILNNSKEDINDLDLNDNSFDGEEARGEKEKSKPKKKYNSSKFRESVKYRPKQNKDSTKVKAFLKSFKTIKKSLFLLQQKAGTDMDFFLAVKNNVQKSDRACSAGKVLIFTKGSLRKQFFKGGIRHNRKQQYICKNVEDMKQDIVEIEENSERVENEEMEEENSVISDEEGISDNISDEEDISDKTRKNDESYFMFDEATPRTQNESEDLDSPDRGCLIRGRNPDRRVDLEKKRKREERKSREKRQLDESRLDILDTSSTRENSNSTSHPKKGKKTKQNIFNMKRSARKVRTPGDPNFIV